MFVIFNIFYTLKKIFRYLLEHNLVDCVVTSAGGVEEDLIKCIHPTYLGIFIYINVIV